MSWFSSIIFVGALAVSDVFINHAWPIGIYMLNCTGYERILWHCMYHTSDHEMGGDCTQYDDASVFCMRKYNTIIAPNFCGQIFS